MQLCWPYIRFYFIYLFIFKTTLHNFSGSAPLECTSSAVPSQEACAMTNYVTNGETVSARGDKYSMYHHETQTIRKITVIRDLGEVRYGFMSLIPLYIIP